MSSPRPVLVGLLSFTSGSVDVVTLMAIGGAFTSVVTGNLIFVGRAIGTSAIAPATHAALAIVGYMAGVALGSIIARRSAGPTSDEGWPRSATVVLVVECALLLALNIAWLVSRAQPDTDAIDTLLVAAAVALGMQSAAAKEIEGAPSTTYMTGALTTLIGSLATGRRPAQVGSIAVGLLSLGINAACSASLVVHCRDAALAPPLLAVGAVIAVKLREHRTEGR